MRFDITTQPAFEPITLAEARSHVKIPSNITAEDDLLRSFIQQAREYLENCTNHIAGETVMTAKANDFAEVMKIQKGPIQSIDSVKYYNTDNVLTTLVADTDYFASTAGGGSARIYFPSLPDVKKKLDAVEITFTAGYDSIDDIPELIKHPVRLMVKQAYQNRGEYVTGTIVSVLPKTIENYFDSLRIF